MHTKLFNTKLLYLFTIFLNAIDVGFSNDLQYLPKIVQRKLRSLETLPFEDCGSEYEILYVGVSGCSMIPCQMARGSTVMVTVIFNDYGHKISLLKHHVRWILNAIKTNAIITPDPCVDNDHCLSDGNNKKSYTATVLISTTLPNGKSNVWECKESYTIHGKMQEFSLPYERPWSNEMQKVMYHVSCYYEKDTRHNDVGGCRPE